VHHIALDLALEVTEVRCACIDVSCLSGVFQGLERITDLADRLAALHHHGEELSAVTRPSPVVEIGYLRLPSPHYF
jgi:hypothetical protein